MDHSLFNFAGIVVTPALLVLVAVGAVMTLWWRRPGVGTVLQDEVAQALAEARQRELDEKLSSLMRLQAELNGRLTQMGETVDSKHGHLTRVLNERLDGLQARIGEGMTQQLTTTHDNLNRMNERLAVIDEAQKRMGHLTTEMLTLKDILANKQSRGAFGQGRMEAIVRDNLPPSAYEFQFQLSNKTRPDCVIRLPGDPRPLVIDAKFPLEAFTAFRTAQTDEEKKAATGRIQQDVARHIKDIREKYLLTGETQDLAVLFVPAESLYADLQEYFEELVQRAHKERVLIVSPSLLMMAIQVMQAIVRDSKMREQAHVIQVEVQRLLDDVGRLRDRVGKLDTHFKQSQEDVVQIGISMEKILKRGDKITALEVENASVGLTGASSSSITKATLKNQDLGRQDFGHKDLGHKDVSNKEAGNKDNGEVLPFPPR